MTNSVYLLPDFQNNYLELLVGCLPEETIIHRNETARPFAVFLPEIIRCNPDVLHLHWPHPYFLFYGLLPSKFMEKLASWAAAIFFLFQLRISKRFVNTVVWTVHNLENHDQLQPQVERHVHKELADIADEITIWDQESDRLVQDAFNVDTEQTHIVPHNNYLDIYEDAGSGDRPETCDAATGYDRVFLYFGRIRPYKNVEELIKVFRDEINDEHLLIVAGNPEDQLKTRISGLIDNSENVCGDLQYIPDNQVPHYFETADIAVFPYERIFNSGSIVLSMSFGVPFVAPNKGGVPGIAPPGNFVYKTLRQGLREAVDADREQLKLVGQQNLLTARDRHSRERVQAALLECYGWSKSES